MTEPPERKDSASESAVKRRKASCTHCRQRKSKCDGRHPQCSTCIAYKTVCKYDKAPSLAYVRSLEAKVESLSAELRRTKSRYGSQTDMSDQSQSIQLDETISPGLVPSPMSGSAETASHVPIKQESVAWTSEISSDGLGGVSYHNPTSAIHEAPSDEETAYGHDMSVSPTLQAGSMVVTDRTRQAQEIKQGLFANAAAQRQVEDSAVGGIAARHELLPEVASELLNLHWVWLHPLFLFVYRPAFTRDMAAAAVGIQNTPYFSDTLLKVMCAHTARFIVSSSGPSHLTPQHMADLANRANSSLGLEIGYPSCIPTMQALLQQSARECAFGRSSQAWLYSGMAFRMAIDLGIHLPSGRLQQYVKTLTVEDTEVRKRLFWSCYTWDKIISLFLGRMPCFLVKLPEGPIAFMDDFTETEPWAPYYGVLSQDNENRPSYPPTPGRVMSTFTGLCKLSIILAKVMPEIYGTESSDDSTTENSNAKKSMAFVKISTELQSWWMELSPSLQIDVNRLPVISPPPHIVSLNLLYHTTLILLHRPFITNIGASDLTLPAVQRSYQTCQISTSAIHDLLSLQVATFGHRHVTYLNAYSAYIAATIAILHFQIEEEIRHISFPSMSSEKLGLKFFLDVLQKTANNMPGLSRSVAIIRRHMRTVLERQTKKQLATLFPDMHPSPPPPHNAIKPGSDERRLSRPLGISMYASSSMSVDSRPIAGMQGEQYGYQSSFPVFGNEGLPAFPGQQFSVGTDFQFNGEVFDPEVRAAILGQHLDPHIRLQHEKSDSGNGYYINE